MRRYAVTVYELVSQYKSKVFEAESVEKATTLAEAEDWTDSSWELENKGNCETYVDNVTELDE